MEEAKQQQKQGSQQKQVIRYEDISKNVLDKLKLYQEDGSIKLPANYSAANALKTAWLIIQETKDKADRPALEVCTRESIARALMDMVMKGFSAAKKQCYFIVHGNRLTLHDSYFGSMALAKNVTMGKMEDPVANVIYEGDVFEFEVNATTGRKKILKHTQSLDNIDMSKIKGAYCVYNVGGVVDVEIMTMAQIRKAWDQGPMKGGSGAHKNFTDQMCRKTVISRACKTIINSSNDAWLYESDPDAEHTPSEDAKEVRNSITNGTKQVVNIEEVEYVDMDNSQSANKQDADPGDTMPLEPQATNVPF